MNAALAVRKTITRKGPDSLWNLGDFPTLPRQAVAQALSRLSRAGFLRRIRKGLYYYPLPTAQGPSRPNTSALFKKVLKRSGKVRIFMGGASADAPGAHVLLSNQPSRKVRIGEHTTHIRQRSFKHLHRATQEDIWILDSLRNLKVIPDSTPADAVTQIIQHLKSSRRSLKKLLEFAMGEPPRVRAVLGAIVEHLGYKGWELRALKRTLNPLSKYKIDIGSVLRNAAAWNIR